MDIPRQSQEKLKQLVKDFLTGRVFCSEQVRDSHILGMVFMPIALGGLSYPVPKPDLPPEPEYPEKPGLKRPQRPEPNVSKVLDRLDVQIRRAQERVRDTEFKIRWEDAPVEDLAIAKARLDKLLVARGRAKALAQREADRQYEVLMVEYRKALDARREVVRAWRERRKEWKTACEAMKDKMDEWEAGRKVYFAKMEENLGVIYAYMDDAFQRSINGYPMFASCCLLHKEDWKIVRAAIVREQERLENIDLAIPAGNVSQEES